VSPDLPALIAALRGRWWLVLAGALAGLLAASAWVRLTPPDYEAVMVVGPGSDPMEAPDAPSGLGRLAALQGLTLGEAEQVSDFDQFLHLLTSVPLARRLTASDRGEAVLPAMFPESWDAVDETWRPPPGPAAWLARQARTLLGRPAWQPPGAEELAEEFGRRLTVDRVGSTAMRRLGFFHRDRAQAAAILAALQRGADAMIRDTALRRADAQIAYLADQRDAVALAMHDEALTWLLRREERRRMMLSVDLPFAATVIEPVTVGRDPARPDPVLVIPLATAAGLAAGVLLALLLARAAGGPAQRPR
jgi:uncharacterized protein involved in exopolysaccharide biosynthesis